MKRIDKICRMLLCAAICLTVLPLLSLAADDDTPEVFSVRRPRTQEEFDKEMQALYSKYGGDTSGYAKKLADEEKIWKQEVKDYNSEVEKWNKAHPNDLQSTISIDDDSGVDGNDEESDDWEKANDNEGDIKYGKYKEGDEESLLKMYGDTGYQDGEKYTDADGNEIVDDHKNADEINDEDVEAEKKKAINDDDDGLGNKIENWVEGAAAIPVAGAENAVIAKAQSMINTKAKEIEEGFFSNIIENLPFFNDHKKAYEEFEGHPAWTETQTLRKVKTSAFYLYEAQGWKITVLRGRKHGKADILLTREHEATGLYAMDLEESYSEPDWQELGEAPDNYLDEASFADFDWDFGGFGGGKSVWGGDPGNGSGPVIGNLKMGSDGLSFEYENGLSGWGLEDEEYEGGQYGGAYACLFVQDNDGNWVGGKFDWISTSRQTRDFKNIYSGYNGWNLANVPKTTTAAFVIVSKDGKWRSNVITALWER